ncbi:PREDICTED: uncharacterized protein LOC108754309 [Trachymyrmex septentrionalis]|uniref:uncharacterized protein LOC108754309 n=1 Tax=Trachymyrmex septentrionalis TaxID=34720 RepID=UPI00084ED7C9|nr:PREDICTED: uncharacterized protein LOC108754309 [Trachymyrmex septentrionalis]
MVPLNRISHHSLSHYLIVLSPLLAIARCVSPQSAAIDILTRVHSLFHVNNTRVSAKASSELHSSRRRCHPREIVVIVHVAFAPLEDLDKDHRRRHRVSGLSGVAKERDVVRSGRRHCSYQPEMSDHGCIHLNNFKAAKGIQPYKVIHSFFVTSTSTEARVRKV